MASRPTGKQQPPDTTPDANLIADNYNAITGGLKNTITPNVGSTVKTGGQGTVGSNAATNPDLTMVFGSKLGKLSQKLDEDIAKYAMPLSQKDKEAAKQGQPKRNIIEKGLFGLLNYGVLKPLQTIDVGRRVVLSTVKETADIFGGGDASFKDLGSQIKDVNLSSKKLFNIDTGHKWLDSALGFTVDVLADPTTYLTLGTGTAAKIALQQTTKTIARELGEKAAVELTEKFIREAAEDLATKTVKQATEAAAKKVATQLGKGATAKEIRVASRAIAAEAGKIAVEDGVEGAAKKAAQAAARYSAVGPRRTLGAGGREARAIALRDARQQALLEVERATAGGFKTQARVAQRFADSLSDATIEQLAKRGASAITSDLAKEMGLYGGLKWGAFGARTGLTTSVGKTAPLIRGAGKVGTAIRQSGIPVGVPLTGIKGRIPGVANIAIPKGGGKTLADLFTPRGATELVFDARTGLRKGTLDTAQTMKALDVIAADNTLKAYRSAITKTIKVAAANTAKAEYKPFRFTVHELLAPAVNLDGTVDEITKQAGREVAVSPKEIEFAKAVREFGTETADAMYAVAGAAAPDAAKTITLPDGTVAEVTARNWFPEVLTNKAVRFLNSGTPEAKAVLRAMGLEMAPLPGHNFGNQLVSGVKFFGKNLEVDDINGGIKALNEVARKGGFKGDFFDTDVTGAVLKYGKKFADDYSIARLVAKGTYDIRQGKRAALGSIDPFSSRDILDQVTKGTLKELKDSNAVAPWAIEDLEDGATALTAARNRATTAPLKDWEKDNLTQAIDEVDTILKALEKGIRNKDDIATTWATLGLDLQNQYITLFARPKKQVVKFLEDLDTTQLKTMVNLMDDAFVSLDMAIAPDAIARADIASIYKNINKLRQTKNAGPALQLWKDLTQTSKTWYTATPGFHLRNWLSNYFQMLAGGGDVTYLREGRNISNKWNEFLKEQIEITREDGAIDVWLSRPPEEWIQRFFEVKNIPKNQRAAAEEALMSVGASGFGDIEEVFSAVANRVGATGREVTGTGVGARVSSAVGEVPRLSRKVGNKVENQARFMFTYDGIRQGLNADESVARTSKFLIDYSDTNAIDDVLKQIIPFWMFMSRNLPTQLMNMYTSPGLYQKYNAFRRNFTDANGKNDMLPSYLSGSAGLPSYLSKSGATYLADIPGIGGVFAKPDFGFPGSGSPSPLQEGITDPNSLVNALNPILKGLIEQGTGRDLYTGVPMGGKERVQSGIENLFPIVSTAARYLNPLVAGTDIPGISSIPGVYQSETAGGYQKDTPDNIKKLQTLLSLLGIPGGIVSGNEVNAKRYEIINALKEYQKK